MQAKRSTTQLELFNDSPLDETSLFHDPGRPGFFSIFVRPAMANPRQRSPIAWTFSRKSSPRLTGTTTPISAKRSSSNRTAALSTCGGWAWPLSIWIPTKRSGACGPRRK